MTALTLRYVALGDSTGVGVGALEGGGYVERLFQRLRREMSGVGLLNLCVSGATSAQVLADQLPKAVRARPTVATLGAGVNDVTRSVPVEQYERNLEAIASGLAETGAQVVVANLPDLALAPVAKLVSRELYEGRFESLNAAIYRVAARHGMRVVDVFSRSREEIPRHPEFFCPDGFHPSAEGYALWADLMWPEFFRAASSARPASAAPPPARGRSSPDLV